MRIGRRLFLSLLSAPWYPAVPLRVLSADEARVVEALCGQIIPADDWPGAVEAGVLYYIEKQLSGPFARFAGDYKSGVTALTSAARQHSGRAFTELDFAEQKAFLQRMEAAGDSELNRFWQMVIDHTMQGFYGSPIHGGNKGETSWKMLEIADVMEGHKH
jgi:gluconate 2-dehydrogenase gamma chain